MRDLVEVHPFMTSMNEESIELVSGCARNAVFAPGSCSVLKAGTPTPSTCCGEVRSR